MKASLVRRLLAFLIDAGISAIFALIPLAGGLCAAAYILARDGLMDGRSPGKWLLHLQVVKADTGCGADCVDSLKRNLIFAAPDALMLAPALALMLAAPLSVAVLVIEIVFMLTDTEQMRLGDRFAGTRVIQTLPQAASHKAA